MKISRINPRKIAIAILFLIGTIFVLGLTSCDPAKRIARIAKRHPELVKSDTVFTKIIDTIPAISVKTEFETNKDVSGIDSILQQLSGKIDSVSKSRLSNQIKNYVINRAIIADTITQVIDGIIVRLYQTGDQIGVLIDKPQQIKEKTVATLISSLSVNQVLTWDQELKLWIWDNALWLFLIYILLRFLWNKFGFILKKRFPFLNLF